MLQITEGHSLRAESTFPSRSALATVRKINKKGKDINLFNSNMCFVKKIHKRQNRVTDQKIIEETEYCANYF